MKEKIIEYFLALRNIIDGQKRIALIMGRPMDSKIYLYVSKCRELIGSDFEFFAQQAKIFGYSFKSVQSSGLLNKKDIYKHFSLEQEEVHIAINFEEIRKAKMDFWQAGGYLMVQEAMKDEYAFTKAICIELHKEFGEPELTIKK